MISYFLPGSVFVSNPTPWMRSPKHPEFAFVLSRHSGRGGCIGCAFLVDGGDKSAACATHDCSAGQWVPVEDAVLLQLERSNQGWSS